MPWSDILIILNTIDTALGVLFLTASWFGLRAWWRSRYAQAGQDAGESLEKKEDHIKGGY